MGFWRVPFWENDLNTDLECVLGMFNDDTKLGEDVDSLKGKEALQKSLDKSEGCVITSHMKFN